jgi:hypothetical protein
MYANGQGVKQDFKEAFKWLQKTADQGYAKGKLSLISETCVSVKKSIICLGLVVVLPQKPIGCQIKTIYGTHRGKPIEVSYKIIVKLNLKCPVCIFVVICALNPLAEIVPCHSRHIGWIKWAGQNQEDIHF